MLSIGIDPGKKGAIAAISSVTHAVIVHTFPMMPSGGVKEELNIVVLQKLLDNILSSVIDTDIRTIIEKSTARPGQGVTSMFNYGDGFGQLKAMCRLWTYKDSVSDPQHVPMILVTPQRWKKIVLEGTAKDKDAAINHVMNKYPNTSLLPTSRSRKPHDGMADAICIAEYGLTLP